MTINTIQGSPAVFLTSGINN